MTFIHSTASWILLSALLASAGCSGSNPKSEAAKTPTKAGPPPEVFKVRFDTSRGPFVMEVHRSWAPYGVDHFYDLLNNKFYDEVRFFRVRPKFVVQFGINGDPSLEELWRQLTIVDDPVKQHNRRGYVSYAKAGPNSRTTQIFINLADNSSQLDTTGFAPFALVTEGMDVVDQLYKGYGEMAPNGPGPDPSKIETQGNQYLIDHYPKLDYIKTARIL